MGLQPDGEDPNDQGLFVEKECGMYEQDQKAKKSTQNAFNQGQDPALFYDTGCPDRCFGRDQL
jgi:hypothetical protein